MFRPYLQFVLAFPRGDATQNGPWLPRVLSQLNHGGLVACVEKLGVGCQAFDLADESLSLLSGESLQRNGLIDPTTVVAVVGTDPLRLLLGEHPPEPRGHSYVTEYALEKIDSLVGSTVRISNPVANDACVERGRLDLLGSDKTHQIV